LTLQAIVGKFAAASIAKNTGPYIEVTKDDD